MRTLRALHVSTAVLLGTLASAGSAYAGPLPDWTEIGPAPFGNSDSGRTISVAPHPTDSNIFYVGAATGGVWKNQGGMWTPLTDKMPWSPIGALAIDPTNPNVIYAGTGEPHSGLHAFYGVGLYKSTDGGATWEHLAENTLGGRSFSTIVIHPANTQILFAALGHSGLAYPGGITAMKGHPGSTSPGGVFKSTDGGVNWTQVAGGLPAVDANDIVMAPDNPNTLYVAIGAHLGDPANGIYKSTDGGDTWTKLGGGFPAAPGRTRLAIAKSNPQRLYASIAGPGNDTSSTASVTIGAWKTDDAGATWTNMNAGSYMGNQGNYDNCVLVDQSNADIAYFGGVSQTMTSNGGTSFTSASAPHSDHQGLGQLPNGDIISVTDGGVARRAAGSTTWTRMGAGYGVTQLYAGISIHPTNRDFLLGGFQDNGSHLSTAKGMWRSVGGGDGGPTALHPANPNVMFLTVYNAGALSRSTNGGMNFTRSSTGIATSDRTAFYHVTLFHPTDPMIVFTATHRLYKSTNQGSNWTPIGPADVTGGAPYAIRAMAIAPSNPDVIWVSTNDHKVLVSSDGGNTFAQKTEAEGWRRVTRELSVPPWDDQSAIVTVQRFGTDQVKMTKDLGATWTAIDGDLGDFPVNSVDTGWVQSRKAIFIATDRGVFFSCNEGQHWEKLGTTLPTAQWNDIRYDPYFKRVVVSGMGRGVWEIDEPSMDMCPIIDGGGGGTGGAGGAGGAGGGGAGGGGAGAGGTGGTGGTTGGGAGAAGGTGRDGGTTGGTAGAAGNGGSAGAGMGGAGGSGAGAGGSSGTAGTAGSTGTAGATGTGGAGTTGGSAGSAPPPTTDDSGCNCNLANRNHSTTGFSLGLAGLLAVFGRRRRRPGSR